MSADKAILSGRAQPHCGPSQNFVTFGLHANPQQQTTKNNSQLQEVIVEEVYKRTRVFEEASGRASRSAKSVSSRTHGRSRSSMMEGRPQYL
jgi:hypothetical protein